MMSKEFKHLMEKMMNPNPKNRLTLDQIKAHPFMTKEHPADLIVRKDIILNYKSEPLFRIKVYPDDETTVEYNSLSEAPVNSEQCIDAFRSLLSPAARASAWV